jgi:hypothetical protein
MTPCAPRRCSRGRASTPSPSPRPFICNPDLAERFARGAPLTPMADPAVIYGGGEAGYIDFARMAG